MTDQWRDANLASWNEAARLHVQDATGFYNVEAFLAGRDSLYPIESAEIGDVRGKRLLHLQCHFGLDTMSLARRGAQVTGLDFSPVALEAARDIAQRSGIAAQFVESDVYAARQVIEGDFDIVYATWGAIGWLPDIKRWAQVAASMLKPGGILYLAEGHPSTLILDDRSGPILPAYGWRTPPGKPERFDESESYTGDALADTTPTYNWIHPLSDIIGGLMDQGLMLEFLHEHETIPWKLFNCMVPAGEGMFRLPDGSVPMPLGFSIRMQKRG